MQALAMMMHTFFSHPTRILALLLLTLALVAVGCGPKRVKSSPGTGETSSQTDKSSKKKGTYKPYTIDGKTYYPLESGHGYEETGMASWYGPTFHGKKTASGETYDMHKMTAAHRTLPMHTRLSVKNLNNGRSVEVRVNDRGPFVGNRIIDLSHAAAQQLDVVRPGTAKVLVYSIGAQPIKYVGPFYVQYGAFVVENNARKLRTKLVARGYAGTRVVKGDLEGTVYWRVQVGPFPTLEKAEANRARLAPESPGCFLIAD